MAFCVRMLWDARNRKLDWNCFNINIPFHSWHGHSGAAWGSQSMSQCSEPVLMNPLSFPSYSFSKSFILSLLPLISAHGEEQEASLFHPVRKVERDGGRKGRRERYIDTGFSFLETPSKSLSFTNSCWLTSMNQQSTRGAKLWWLWTKDLGWNRHWYSRYQQQHWKVKVVFQNYLRKEMRR